MSTATLVVTADGRVCGVHDWTGGFKSLQRPRVVWTEDRILAVALWLEKHGKADEALAFTERFVDRPRVQ